MSCKTCKSERIASVSAKCNDLCYVELKKTDGSYVEHNDYVPDDLGVGGGDYVRINICLDCGQVQGKFPLPESRLEATGSNREHDEDIDVGDDDE